jgi:hypothetical protein
VSDLLQAFCCCPAPYFAPPVWHSLRAPWGHAIHHHRDLQTQHSWGRAASSSKQAASGESEWYPMPLLALCSLLLYMLVVTFLHLDINMGPPEAAC